MVDGLVGLLELEEEEGSRPACDQWEALDFWAEGLEGEIDFEQQAASKLTGVGGGRRSGDPRVGRHLVAGTNWD